MVHGFDGLAIAVSRRTSRRRLARLSATSLISVALAGGASLALPEVALGAGNIAGIGGGSRRQRQDRAPERETSPFRFHLKGTPTELPADGYTTNCRAVVKGTGHVSELGRVRFTIVAFFNPTQIGPDACFPLKGKFIFRATDKDRRGTVRARMVNAENCLMNGEGDGKLTGRLRFTRGTGHYQGATGGAAWKGGTTNGTIRIHGNGTIRTDA